LFKPNAPPCTTANAAQELASVNSEKPILASNRKKVGQNCLLKPKCRFLLMGTKKNTDSAVSKDMVVQNQLGLHARPASMFVKTATKFTSEIMVEKEGESVNGKSIMGLMMLAASHGTILTVTAEGSDASNALNELEELVNRNFEEE
jgi:phosphocarrier protein